MVDGMTDSSIKTQTYLAGHVLFRQGDVADDCYLVREGEISLSRT
jgi:CRP-like cAMP-binding protein